MRVGSGDERPIPKELVMDTVSSDPVLKNDWGMAAVEMEREDLGGDSEEARSRLKRAIGARKIFKF